jgi:hypothetical protein
MKVIIKFIIVGLVLACGARTSFKRNERDAKSISPDSFLKPDSHVKPDSKIQLDSKAKPDKEIEPECNTQIDWKNLTQKCATDAECVAVRICGCQLHEPCGCVIPASEFEKNCDKCIVKARKLSEPDPCPRECLVRNASNRKRCKLYSKYCCDWCTPEGAECYKEKCVSIREEICK